MRAPCRTLCTLTFCVARTCTHQCSDRCDDAGAERAPKIARPQPTNNSNRNETTTTKKKRQQMRERRTLSFMRRSCRCVTCTGGAHARRIEYEVRYTATGNFLYFGVSRRRCRAQDDAPAHPRTTQCIPRTRVRAHLTTV